MNDTIDSLAIRMALKLNKIEESITTGESHQNEKPKSCFKQIFIRLFKSKMYLIYTQFYLCSFRLALTLLPLPIKRVLEGVLTIIARTTF